jgi:hypothetical protein
MSLRLCNFSGIIDQNTILKSCFFYYESCNFPGITEDNTASVDWCVRTSGPEKKIRSAARRLFGSLNSAHKDVLSTEEYIQAVKSMTGADVLEKKLLIAAGE